MNRFLNDQNLNVNRTTLAEWSTFALQACGFTTQFGYHVITHGVSLYTGARISRFISPKMRWNAVLLHVFDKVWQWVLSFLYASIALNASLVNAWIIVARLYALASTALVFEIAEMRCREKTHVDSKKIYPFTPMSKLMLQNPPRRIWRSSSDSECEEYKMGNFRALWWIYSFDFSAFRTWTGYKALVTWEQRFSMINTRCLRKH